MYTKLFAKILDSSIWLEPHPTRIVWITILAAMDEDGFCQFASVPNLAHRALVTLQEAEEAVRVLESADENSADPDHQGIRIERVPGGWMVLNAKKYQDIVKREHMKVQTRERVRRFRSKSECNGDVTQANENVTPLDTDTDTNTKPSDKSAIIFQIAKAHPKLSHLKDETEIPRIVVDRIIEAISKDGEEFVLSGTRDFAASIDPKFAGRPEEFFARFHYRQAFRSEKTGAAIGTDSDGFKQHQCPNCTKVYHESNSNANRVEIFCSQKCEQENQSVRSKMKAAKA
jgi:hypothetical protein